MRRALVIFSGHNDRAVIALARAMEARGVPFFLVARENDDFADHSPYASRIAYRRHSGTVDLELFLQVRNAIKFNGPLVYCPTTEFINAFALLNRTAIEHAGFDIPLPSQELYELLTSKLKSAKLVHDMCQVGTPDPVQWVHAKAPCVFKPKLNIESGNIQYPRICKLQSEVDQAKAELTPANWFVQQYVDGQSYYLCAYIARDGTYTSYWQANLLQQPAGKSIVLARTTTNPGFDERGFISGLVRLGYFGPLMMEVMHLPPSSLFYIEINPRFWGPLQLAASACPTLFDLFVADTGLLSTQSSSPKQLVPITAWYAWAHGAKQTPLRRYPAAASMNDEQIDRLLKQHDVFRGAMKAPRAADSIT